MTQDFGLYWTAARQLIFHQNPYAPATAHGMMRFISPINGMALVPFAPPWLLPFLYPLGFLSPKVGEVVWLFVNVAALTLAVSWLWEIYGENQSILWAVALAFLFPPTVLNFIHAQIGALLLLGIAGFLRYQRSRPYLSGAFLLLCAFKPHLFLLLWVLLLIPEVLDFRILKGFFVAITCTSGIALLLRPTIFSDYLHMVRTYQVATYNTLSFGSLLKQATGLAWIEYFPAVVALLWFGSKWRKGEIESIPMPTTLLASICAAPYLWKTDLILLLPLIYSVFTRWRNRVTSEELTACEVE